MATFVSPDRSICRRRIGCRDQFRRQGRLQASRHRTRCASGGAISIGVQAGLEKGCSRPRHADGGTRSAAGGCSPPQPCRCDLCGSRCCCAPVCAVGLPPRNAAEDAGLRACRVGGAARYRALSLARRSGVVHADSAGRSRLTASSSCVAATVAPSVRIVQATAIQIAQVECWRRLNVYAGRPGA
jgi:hypothetical protein